MLRDLPPDAISGLGKAKRTSVKAEVLGALIALYKSLQSLEKNCIGCRMELSPSKSSLIADVGNAAGSGAGESSANRFDDGLDPEE